MAASQCDSCKICEDSRTGSGEEEIIMPLSNSFKETWLNTVFGNAPFTPLDTLFVGVCQTVDDLGIVFGEPTFDLKYRRVPLSNDTTSWAPTNENLIKSNAVMIIFRPATTDWGMLRYFFISDAPTGGHILGWTLLDTPKHPTGDVNGGDAVAFNINGLEISTEKP